MKYIIVSKNAKFVVTQEERDDFMKRYENSKVPLLRIGNQFIDKYGVEIFELPFYIKQEAENLRIRRMRRCRHCGEILPISEPCGCSDRKELRKDNPFALEETKLLE